MTEAERIVVRGTVENVIYQNNLNGYTVFELRPDSVDDNHDRDEPEITCVAKMPGLNPGEQMTLTGTYIVHAAYGRQFQVEMYEKTMPVSADGIARYLGSGVIRGIGEKLAQRIVKEFGADTFIVLENSPEKLAQVRGITVEKALAIGVRFAETFAERSTMMFLQNLGITPVYAQKIFKKFKQGAIDAVKNNPYVLAEDVIGIGFKMADSIAARLGVDRAAPARVKAGVQYILNQAAANGHVYLPKTMLLEAAAELLLVPEELAEDMLTSMQFEHTIWQEKRDGDTIVYLNMYYYAESYIAKKLLELTQNALDKSAQVDKAIERIGKEQDVQLAERQKEAVRAAMESGVLVITGGPGTGKTTTINTIIQLLMQSDITIELAAPTGRAAKRMTEATGVPAKTIHRLLGVSFGEEDSASRRMRFEKNEADELEADVIIIDESSMIDVMLMSHLLKAIPNGARLILVGDIDQLPSVGAGNVLKDIIASDAVRVIRLTDIFRQAQESAIVMNAHRINNGEQLLLNDKNSDFFFVKRPNIESTAQAVVELVTKRLPEYAQADSLRDIQVLTPMRKTALGVAELNKLLQAALNPPHPARMEKELRGNVLREGDKVMQIKNNYNMAWFTRDARGRTTDEGMGIFNGDEGIIQKIDDPGQTIDVLFDDDRLVRYDYTQLDELELSYAVTIHKSQGSEYKIVVIPLFGGPPMLLSRNLLYTAVTRAKTLAVIVGQPETLFRMVDNNRETHRNTTLCERIQKMLAFMEANEDA